MLLSLFSIVLIALAITVPTVVLAAKDHHVKPLRVGAFNVRQFGKSKICRYNVAHTLGKILQRYDIVVVQEVMDVSQSSIDTFLSILKTRDENWAYVASHRLGRSKHKEQYVFYYKTNPVVVEDSYQLSDDDDIFEREPFAIKIRYTSASTGRTQGVALSSIHVKPKDVFAELTELPSAIRNISKSFSSISGVIMMGDFNADCSYLNQDSQNTLPIFSSKAYKSLIPHTADTTVSKTDCAYDRILIFGSGIDARNAQVYKFEKDLKLNTTEALKISDHYPVEFLLY